MKMQILKKNLKINIWKIKKYHKVKDHYHYTGEYRGAAHRICYLRFSALKNIAIGFYNWSNYWLLFHFESVSRRI